MSDRLEIRMSPDLLLRLDGARGDVPRGTFIKRALERALGESTEGSMSPASSRAPVEKEPELSPGSRAAVERGIADARAGRLTDGPSRQAPSIAETWRR